uniref:Helitron helicase n=1 Tax=Heterorhabditis bacteriophora TaxID=37862 RepID=A0A1I7XPD0_HETBA
MFLPKIPRNESSKVDLPKNDSCNRNVDTVLELTDHVTNTDYTSTVCSAICYETANRRGYTPNVEADITLNYVQIVREPLHSQLSSRKLLR